MGRPMVPMLILTYGQELNFVQSWQSRVCYPSQNKKKSNTTIKLMQNCLTFYSALTYKERL
jgi:hypothetical protein